MLRLLGVKEADFSLEVADGDPPPKLAMQVALAEVVADEHAVAQAKIKNVLYRCPREAAEDEPIVDNQSGEENAKSATVSDNVVTETAPKKKKKSKKKLMEELEEPKVRQPPATRRRRSTAQI